MSVTSISDIEFWLNNVQTQESPSIAPIIPWPSCDKENPRQVKKRHIVPADQEHTPRPSKRLRNFDDAPQFPAASSARSVSSKEESEAFEAESHQSGRLSPLKQIQILEDSEEYPVIFCNFDDLTEPEDVTLMRRAVQRFADGNGILGYDDLDAVVCALPAIDNMRFLYPWTNNLELRSTLDSMPSMARVLGIVEMARGYDRGSGASEDEWNSEVQYPLLKLACSTSSHSKTLEIFNVIEPASLARSTLPGRVVDYVVTIKPDEAIKQAWLHLRPLRGMPIKSWNHTTRARQNPIAINIETKGPMKSWTDGKPQIAIWVDALLKRLALIRGAPSWTRPALPLLIAQGHDWHLLFVSTDSQKMTIWEQIDIGSTRSCFDAMKVVAVLHWLMDWAERVWRPWFLSLIGPEF
ncbi:MAG: hypothetical protein M1829_006927 [Trizodia sp. TS-e1964]|nr:MAG: hypothetical protein M1829_006927 [Trizodia sp. TS-e1964]